MKCPECGVEREFSSSTCQNCHYVYRYDDIADYTTQEIAFTVEFRCKNCGDTIKRGFGKGDEVRPKGAGPNFQRNEVTGNPYIATIDGDRCRLQCPTCESDTSLYDVKRTPIRER